MEGPAGDGEAPVPSPAEVTTVDQGWGCTCGAWGRLPAGASPREVAEYEQFRNDHDVVCDPGDSL